MNLFAKRRIVFLIAFTTVISSCSVPGRLMRGYAEADPVGMESLTSGRTLENASPERRGQIRFMFDDFGSLTTDVLETYGMPWKLYSAALVQNRHVREGAPISLRTLDRVFSEYGFIRPRSVANWVGSQPRLDRPLGLLAGTARRGFPALEVEIANLGCAACHAGPLYGADGHPTGEAWLGLPNSSIDLSAYADETFDALRAELDRPEVLLETVAILFPDVSELEISTMRKFLIPRTLEGLEERYALYGGILPFSNGGPGLMNGVGSLRFLVGGLGHESRSTESAWASPPDLSGTTMRRSLLTDGVYASPRSSRFGPMTRDEVTDEHLEELAGVASLFIVGTQGVQPETARKAIPAVHDVMKFAHTLEPPPFPAPIDHTLAGRGALLYENVCAGCHGRYSPGLGEVRLIEHPNRLVAQDRMLTDSVRWATADPQSLGIIEQIGYSQKIEPLNSGGYVAPDLSGIWATAPYLHNGSVPTLWHLLHPAERPQRFYVGGHALDYELMGIAGTLDSDGLYRYSEDYSPWARAVLYDTREAGRSNAGHEFRNLSEADKEAVLEYMKVL